MNKKMILKDLIDRIDWVTLNVGRTGSRLPDDGVSVAFIKSKKSIDYADYVKIRFGNKVLDALEWKIKDKITAMHDPDDLFNFLLVKRENGRMIQQETNTSVCAVSFKWDRPELKLNRMPSKIVEHEIYKGYLNFRLPNND